MFECVHYNNKLIHNSFCFPNQSNCKLKLLKLFLVIGKKAEVKYKKLMKNKLMNKSLVSTEIIKLETKVAKAHTNY